MLSAAWLILSSLLYSLQLSTGSFPAPLTEEEERHYLALSAQGDLEARNILVERNLRLVAHIMKKYYAQSADQEDLISIGTIGLIKGISTFDPSKGARLATYAARCVENAILSQMRDFAAVWTCQAGNNVLKYFLELVSMRKAPAKETIPMNTVQIEQAALEQTPLLDRETVLQGSKKYWLLRRTQDVLLSLLALLLLWPLMLVVAVIIVLDSPGASPIFTQTRVGRDGKHFSFYKFRSMRPNAEAELDELLPLNEMEGPVFKIKDDPRITRVGKFLRMTSIDELPQLLNVLRGEMSIVGPRPGIPREVEQYDDFARQRLLVTPGLTCYWQIQPNRNRLSFEQWVNLDVKYINERSFLTDWKIILRTFGAVLQMNGE